LYKVGQGSYIGIYDPEEEAEEFKIERQMLEEKFMHLTQSLQVKVPVKFIRKPN